jgi:hypothetical protein
MKLVANFVTSRQLLTPLIMYDLGFPTDAVDIVKNLYEEATTQVRIPSGGHTDQIPVERGTIQGDTLSPFLLS